MAKAVKQPASDVEKIVLSIDIGGSHVKILTIAGGAESAAPTPVRADAAADGRCGDEARRGPVIRRHLEGYPGRSPTTGRWPTPPISARVGRLRFSPRNSAKPVKIVNDA